MALAHMAFRSRTLLMQASVDVILPDPPKDGAGRRDKLATLYLFHGITDDQTSWQRNTAVERYVAGLPLCVVMPSVGRGFYTDMKHGPKWFAYISEELPRVMRGYFPLSERREDNFAAGLSMGGYGALKLGLLKPENYAAIASLSGVVNMAGRYEARRDANRMADDEIYSIFGTPEEMKDSDNDVMHLLRRMAATPERCPKLFVCCGAEDFMIKDHRALRDEFEGRLPLTCEESPGAHEWDYWDAQLRRMIKWLPIKNENN